MGLALSRNGTPVQFNHFFANSQPDTRAWIMLLPVETLKNSKNPIQVFFIKTDAMIFNLNFSTSRLTGQGRRVFNYLTHNIYPWGDTGLAKLECVTNQILE